MANKRLLVRRRKTARNIRKITRTMQLIATARFQAAMKRSLASKPYTQKLAELVGDLSAAARSVEHPLLRAKEGVRRSILAVLTSNRGLCGGYNANVLRAGLEHLERTKREGGVCDLHVVGKKGISFFRFLRRPMAERITHIGDRPGFDQVEPIANGLMELFSRGEVGSVHVAYMQFISVSVQRPTVWRLLPIAAGTVEDPLQAASGQTPAAGEVRREAASPQAEYEFSPAPTALLDELLPATVRVGLFQCFTDAVVSEQLARMVAMKAATDAAGDRIRLLTRQYNRARQTSITMELLDIVGGANALA